MSLISNNKNCKIIKCTVWLMKVQFNRLTIFQWSQALFFQNKLKILNLKDFSSQRRRKEKHHNMRDKNNTEKWWLQVKIRRCQRKKERETMFKQFHLYEIKNKLNCFYWSLLLCLNYIFFEFLYNDILRINYIKAN